MNKGSGARMNSIPWVLSRPLDLSRVWQGTAGARVGGKNAHEWDPVTAACSTSYVMLRDSVHSISLEL